MNLSDVNINKVIGQVADALRGGMNFAPYLKIARITKGMSRLELAAKAGTSCSTLSALENSRRAPGAKVLGRLASALDLDRSQRAYFLSLAAEAQIKAADRRKNSHPDNQPQKRAALTPMTDEERAALEKILKEAREVGSGCQVGMERLPAFPTQ